MKAKTGFLLSDRVHNLKKLVYLLVICFLPTQLGRHFFISDSFVLGIRIDYLAPTIYITDILILILFFLFLPELYQTIVKKKLRFQPLPLFLTACILIPFLYHGMFHPSPLVFYAMGKCFELVFFFFVNVWFFSEKKSLRLFFFALSLGMFFESLLTYFQVLLQSSVNGIGYLFGERRFNSLTPGIATTAINGMVYLRPYATFPHPNVLAGYLFFGIVFLWYGFHMSKERIRIWYMIVVLCSFLGMLLTLSRSVITLFVISGILISVKHLIKAKNRFGLGSGIFIILIILFHLLERIVQISQSFITSESFLKRVELTEISLAMFSSEPVFGVGPMMFIPQLPSYMPDFSAIFFLQPVHNLFLLMISELGIGGILFVITGILWMFERIRKTGFRPPSSIIFFAVLFLGMADHYFLTLQQGQLLIVALIAYVIVQTKTVSHSRLKKI